MQRVRSFPELCPVGNIDTRRSPNKALLALHALLARLVLLALLLQVLRRHSTIFQVLGHPTGLLTAVYVAQFFSGPQFVFLVSGDPALPPSPRRCRTFLTVRRPLWRDPASTGELVDNVDTHGENELRDVWMVSSV